MELVVGARRPLSNKKVLLDCLTDRLKLWPSDNELGRILTATLTTPDPLAKYDTDSPWSISSARSYDDFKYSFQAFCIWTKSDPGTPIIIGAPISDRYPDTFNRRYIEKNKSEAAIGAEMSGFMRAIASELNKAGLDRWKQ
jgi:hypothetical protein